MVRCPLLVQRFWRKTKMIKPVGVIIGDIHFTPSTLELASKALTSALDKAIELEVPLVLNGDTLDSKAIIRAECANRLISIISKAPQTTQIIINVGNHERLNEKGEEHSLHFLQPYAYVIDRQVYHAGLQAYIIPYLSDTEKLKRALSCVPKNTTIIMHQGVETANMGHYVQDRTSLSKKYFENFKVVASHYHKAQSLKCGASGVYTYIGNPYTLSFGEANDGPKGYSILYSDGHVEMVPLLLRSHRIIEYNIYDTGLLLTDISSFQKDDIIWLKIYGPASKLSTLKKKELGKRLFGHDNFKLDLYPDVEQATVKNIDQTPLQLFDSLIDSSTKDIVQKDELKSLLRELIK